MCPRYWCLKTNKPMTAEQVEKGECGGKIIPQDKKTKIPQGHYIYEFTDSRQHIDIKGEYVNYNPGFLDKSKSTGTHGIPCCFRNPFETKQNDLRSYYNIGEDDITIGNNDMISGKKSDNIRAKRNYLNILSVERVPIPIHRWGFLPLSVELFLHTNNLESVDPKQSTSIQRGKSPLLRYGVERSSKRSFIACIANIYTYHNNIPTPTITEMLNIIISKLSLDIYMRSQNGSLVPLFQPKRINISDIEVENYKDTQVYKSTDLSNSEDYRSLKYKIASYQNFLKYLNDDDSLIDYTFLWDIITSQETGLFNMGLNLVIMEIEDNDIRDNISLICPTNSYNHKFYDSKRGTVLLLKQNEYYEPIYVYGNTKEEIASNKINSIKIFYMENTPTSLVPIFKNIENSINNYCKPTNKQRNYTYKSNISLPLLLNEINKINFKVQEQVINYRGKIIGITATDINSDNKIFIPCSPSVSVKDIKIITIDNVEWLDYSTTINLLQVISNRSNSKILCKPMVKLEEDGLIIGILTETNQLILINKPIQNTLTDDIATIKTYSYKKYYSIDKAITTSEEGDNERKKTIRNIELETKFYLQFREKLRDLLNDLTNQEQRDNIYEISTSQVYVFAVKMQKINELIRQILSPVIKFTNFADDTLDLIYNNNRYSPDNKGFCMSSKNQLCVPRYNLISNQDNQVYYFLKLSDELIRYSRIRTFIFDPTYNKIINLEYSVLPSESLLLNSHITNEYFDNLNMSNIHNEYVNSIPYELAIPITQNKTYYNISLDQQITNIQYNNANFEEECIMQITNITDKNNWNNIFTNKHTITDIKNTPLCGFYIISKILKIHSNVEENIYSIKQLLIKAYHKIIKSNKHLAMVIYAILSKEFKQMYISKIQTKILSLETMIMNDSYFITHFDLWVLCNDLNLPVILCSDYIFKLYKISFNYIILGGDIKTDNYICINSNAYKNKNQYPSRYSIIQPTIPLYTKDFIFVKENLLEFLQEYNKKRVKIVVK